MPHVTRVTIKVFLNELLFSVEDSTISKIKPHQKTTLFCFGSFAFSWHIVSNYLFVFFSDKTTVQWYFIVGPSLAITVLAFIVFYLRKRRIAGTYTSFNKFFCILNASSRWKTPNMHYSDTRKQHNFILVTTPILKGEIRLSFDSNDYFFILITHLWRLKAVLLQLPCDCS